MLHEKFSAPIGTYGNALLNWTQSSANEISSYAWSYRCAAMNLISFQEKREFGTIDNHALPILFLYRHSFELYLKSLAYRAALSTISEEELIPTLPRLWREHSLCRLVDLCAAVLGDRLLDTYGGELHDKIAKVAQELDEIDAGSYAFRYPVTARGEPALPPHFLTNIFVYSETLEGVLDGLNEYCRFLEGRRIESSTQMKLAFHRFREA